MNKQALCLPTQVTQITPKRSSPVVTKPISQSWNAQHQIATNQKDTFPPRGAARSQKKQASNKQRSLIFTLNAFNPQPISKATIYQKGSHPRTRLSGDLNNKQKDALSSAGISNHSPSTPPKTQRLKNNLNRQTTRTQRPCTRSPLVSEKLPSLGQSKIRTFG